ncbi:trypsin-like cysteine/serine peptidase domain-containing protein [Nemania abortiva]|nr:trypsin-like cysteine/serine peptidase domain-containing protein [Nemania abortiva]
MAKPRCCEGLVATAAHVVEDLDFSTHVAVFDFTLEHNQPTVRIPKSKVFHISRIVQQDKRRSSFDYELPALFSTSVDLQSYILQNTDPDRAIIQLSTRENPTFPPALEMQLGTPILGTPVFTIGTPYGVPFKYSSGGSIREVVMKDLTDGEAMDYLPTETLSADISTFKGNSGGPLINSNTNAVVGIVRSGLSPSRLGVYQGTDIQPSQLTTEVNKWRDGRVLEFSGGSFGPPVHESYLHNYSDFQTDTQNKNVFWYRAFPEDQSILYTNLFTRADSYAILAQPISSMIEGTGPGSMKGDVSLKLRVVWSKNHEFRPIQSGLQLHWNMPHLLVGDTVPQQNKRPEDGITWQLQGRQPSRATNATTPYRLPPELYTQRLMLWRLRTIELKRVAGAINPQETAPLGGTITASYNIAPDTQQPPRWTEKKMVWKVKFEFSVNKQDARNSSWIAGIGGPFGPWEQIR